MLQASPMMASFGYKARRAAALFQRGAIGLAQDFWKDGNEKLFATQTKSRQRPAGPTTRAAGVIWRAAPGEVSEKMWGAGAVMPADDYINDLLLTPLNLKKGMTVLDLAAGLGSRMMFAMENYGALVRGREPDPELALRGQAFLNEGGWGEATLIAYDPMSLYEEEKYDCIVARETIYRVADRERFVNAVVACCKPEAQVSFTDYIVNPEAKNQPEIMAWQAFEGDADPIGLVEMAELWAKAGIRLRVHDDETEAYKKEVKKGLRQFAAFMASGVRPDAQTKKLIEMRVRTWAHRMAAMESGMRFYRFYGQR